VELKRGDLAIVSAPGSYGKPRPSVIIQSDLYEGTGSLVVLLMTTKLHPDSPLIRYNILPTATNGLNEPTDVMIDKLFTVPRERMGERIGRLTAAQMAEITSELAVFLGM
jgi:mRNA interferase MazF